MAVLWILAALPALLLALVLLAVTIGAISYKRRLAAIGRLTCDRCGVVLGPTVVRIAETERREALAAIHADAQGRGMRLRVVGPPLRVACSMCGHTAEFPL